MPIYCTLAKRLGTPPERQFKGKKSLNEEEVAHDIKHLKHSHGLRETSFKLRAFTAQLK